MKRQFLCGRDFGSSYPMNINLAENTPAGLIIIRDRENNTKKSGGRECDLRNRGPLEAAVRV